MDRKVLYKDRTILRDIKRGEEREANKIMKLENNKNLRNEQLNKLRGISSQNKKVVPPSTIEALSRMEKLKQYKIAKQQKIQVEKNKKVFKVAHFSPTDYQLQNMDIVKNEKKVIINTAVTKQYFSDKNVENTQPPLESRILRNKIIIINPPQDKVRKNKNSVKLSNSKENIDVKTQTKTILKKSNDIKKTQNLPITKSYVSENYRNIPIINSSSHKCKQNINGNNIKNGNFTNNTNVITADNKKPIQQKISLIEHNSVADFFTPLTQRYEPIEISRSLKSPPILSSFMNISSVATSILTNVSTPSTAISTSSTSSPIQCVTSLFSSTEASTTEVSSSDISKTTNFILFKTPKSDKEIILLGSKLNDTLNENLEMDMNLEIEENGSFFRLKLDQETKKLELLCEKWRKRQNTESLPEEVCDQIRISIGKADLLMRKRMVQFRELIDQNLFKTGERPVTNLDLCGFWDLVMQQIDDVNSNFEKIDQLLEGNRLVEDIPPKKLTKKLQTKSKIPAKKINAEGVSTFALFRQQLQNKKTEISQQSLEDKCLKTFDGGFFKVDSPVKNIKSNSKSTEIRINSPVKRIPTTPKVASPFLKMVLISQLKKSIDKDKSSLTPLLRDKLTIDPQAEESMISIHNTTTTTSILRSSRRSLAMSDEANESYNNHRRHSKRKSVCFGNVDKFENKENDLEESKTSIIISPLEALQMKSFKKLNVNYTPNQSIKRISGFTPPLIEKLDILEDDLISFTPVNIKNPRRSKRYSSKNLSPIQD